MSGNNSASPNKETTMRSNDMETFSKMVAEVVCCHNLIAVFAAPRVAARMASKVQQLPPSEVVLEHLDHYFAFIAYCQEHPGSGGDWDPVKSDPYAIKLRELFRTWSPSPDIPPEIMQNARGFLEACGLPAPGEGWDQWLPDDFMIDKAADPAQREE
jgi:hypothetical protein